MALVTVVIPTYNCAAYIEETLQSVFAQTYHDYEIVVVDSSTDETPQLLSRYGARLRVVRQPPRGVAAARNAGLHLARGRYVALLDGDDVWEPQLLQTQLAALEAHPEAVMSFADVRKFGSTLEISSASKPVREQRRFQDWVRTHATNEPHTAVGNLHEVLLWGNVVPTSSVVLQRQRALASGLFDEQFAVTEDYEYWLRLSLWFPVVYVGRPLVSYRIRQTGLSGSFATRSERFLTARIRVLQKHLRESDPWLSKAERLILRRRLATMRYRLGTISLKRGDGRVAVRQLSHAIRTLHTVGLEFATHRSSWPQRATLLLKPYAVWALSGLAAFKSGLHIE